MAAVLACGRGALLSHKPAGAVWAIKPMDGGRIDVTVRSRTGRRGPPGVTVHRPRSLSSLDADRHAGIPITSPARTLFDLAELIPPSALERAVERAEALRLFDLRQVRRLLAASRGRRGSRALAEILDNAAAEPAITRSELEELFLELCSRHGVPRPLAGGRVGPYEVDFLWPGERVPTAACITGPARRSSATAPATPGSSPPATGCRGSRTGRSPASRVLRPRGSGRCCADPGRPSSSR